MNARDSVTVGAAIAAGIAFAFIDSRPQWDDAGVLAVAMLVTGAFAGLIAPRRPWLLGLCIGIWIPAHAIARAVDVMSFAMLIVLAFPIVGAYAGSIFRTRLI
jgi:hypothetical protein